MLFIVATAASGLGLIAWWARDELTKRPEAGPVPDLVAEPRTLASGPGLCPETVAAASSAIPADRWFDDTLSHPASLGWTLDVPAGVTSRP